jgi:hypothetical protein
VEEKTIGFQRQGRGAGNDPFGRQSTGERSVDTDMRLPVSARRRNLPADRLRIAGLDE